jgi:glycosyltransferase involved in cell wall biosynthesis
VWLVDEFGHGGIGRYAVDVAALLSSEHCVPVVATTGDGPVAGATVGSEVWFPRPVSGVLGKIGAALVGMVKVVSRPARDDVVWVPLGIRPAYELGLVALRRLCRGRVVVTVHNRKPHARAGQSWAVNAACRLAHEVIVHTRALELLLISHRVSPTRLPFPPPRLIGAAVGRAPTRDADHLVISLLGYQYRYKGPDLLLRAFARVRRTDLRIILAGRPAPDLDLPALVDELGLAERVTLRLGFLAEADLAALLDQTDIIALPYRDIDNTGIGAAARERGLPAVASDLPALRELFGDAAVYVAPGDVEGLALALETLPQTHAHLARRAQLAFTGDAPLSAAYRELARRWASGSDRRTEASRPR